ncbi:MAG: glycosyltransferase family 4 protein, partial [Nostocales cyanobacterium W4_Combined_metabat2_030]|nr:glycosyltransferase family 4 protein [Nostocales cyanobacterium W4_Combined_metabat2_030]
MVATDLPGTRELIVPGRTGWLVRPNDPADLAERLLEALSDPLQRATVAAA